MTPLGRVTFHYHPLFFPFDGSNPRCANSKSRMISSFNLRGEYLVVYLKLEKKAVIFLVRVYRNKLDMLRWTFLHN